MKPFWSQIEEVNLAQGDLLYECLIPMFAPDFGAPPETALVPVSTADLVIVTQSCDLENKKVQLVACCPIHTLAKFTEANPRFAKKDYRESVRKGRIEGLHLLASPENPDNNELALVVDFGQIISLPFDYLESRAISLGKRWRLDSPFLEHFSQAFARFFMRVGLPSTVPSFK